MLVLLVISRGWCQEDVVEVTDVDRVEYNYTVKNIGGKFSIEQLMNNVYPHKISNDIDLDPCKSGKPINHSAHSLRSAFITNILIIILVLVKLKIIYLDNMNTFLRKLNFFIQILLL